MNLRTVSLVLLLAIATPVGTPAVTFAQDAPPDPSSASTPAYSTAYLPSDVVAAVGIRNADRHAKSFRQLLERLSFYESDSYRAFFRNAKMFGARVAWAGIAATADTDEWGAVGAALGRDLALGLRLTPRPRFLLVSVPRNPDVARKLLQAVRIIAKSKKIDTVDAERNPIELHAAGRNLYHAFTGQALLISNDATLIKDGLEARRTGRSFRASEASREIAQTIPTDAALWAWADVATARTLMTRAGKWPKHVENPLFAFIAGGWWAHLSSGQRAVAWSVADGDRLKLEIRVDGAPDLPETHRGYLSRGVPMRWAADALPRYVAELAVTRDWAALFQEREELLDLSGVGELSKFLTGIGNFLGDLDLVEDVLPNVNGALRVVVAEQAFDKAAPSPALPAFALVAPIKDVGGKLARQLEKAGQIALTFVNYQAMQEKQPTFMIETEKYRDCRVLSTFYDEVPAKPTIRFNFEPAIAAIGDHYVIATSKSLLRSIADSILSPNDRPAPGPGTDKLAIDAAAVRRLLRKNREPLITNTILSEDVSRRAASKKVDGLIGLLDFFGSFEFSARTEPGRTGMTLDLAFGRGAAKEARK